MRIRCLIAFILLAVVFATGTVQAYASGNGNTIYLPIVRNGSSTSQPGYLIINHNNVDITKIPAQWITAAKGLTFHYAHTSHGSQIRDGLLYWANKNPALGFDYHEGDPDLPDGTSILKMYDGNSYGGNTYVTPDMYWEGTDGINHTRLTATTGLFDYSMWSWCGQMSYYSDEQINDYLTVLNGLEQDYPGMRFIYMTGHSEAAGSDAMETVTANNNLVRSYVQNNNKILFDFADIELYDPNGGNHTTQAGGDGSCPWCDSWCSAHPSYCDATMEEISCAHTHPLFCKMKSAAFWWMMARLAGWDGSY